jgi:hypothetical protein
MLVVHSAVHAEITPLAHLVVDRLRNPTTSGESYPACSSWPLWDTQSEQPASSNVSCAR